MNIAAQSAQKSTRTGILASRVISANSVASTSTGSETGGRVDLQEPQRPVSDRCFGGTRFLAPQVLHGRSMSSSRNYHERQSPMRSVGAKRATCAPLGWWEPSFFAQFRLPSARIMSAYMITRPFTLRAARPTV